MPDCPSAYSRGRAFAAVNDSNTILRSIRRAADADPDRREVESLLVQLEQLGGMDIAPLLEEARHALAAADADAAADTVRVIVSALSADGSGGGGDEWRRERSANPGRGS